MCISRPGVSASFIFILIFASIFSPIALTQPVLKWENTYNSEGTMWDEPVVLKSDKFGNIYLGGSMEANRDQVSSYDFLLIKYNKLGEMEWTRHFNGLDHWDDKLLSMGINDSGFVYLTGQSGNSTLTRMGISTVKYDDKGTIAWLNYFTSIDSEYSKLSPHHFTMDKDNSIYISGYAFKDDQSKFFIVKYSSELKRDVFVSDTTFVFGYESRLSLVNDFIYAYHTMLEDNDYKLSITKCSSELVKIWNKNISILPESRSLKVIPDKDGSLYTLKGYASIAKMDSNGIILHEKEFDKQGNEYAIYQAEIDNVGNLFLAGEVYLSNKVSCFIRKYSSECDLIWERIIDKDSLVIESRKIRFDKNNDIYFLVASRTDVYQDMVVFKYDQEGTLKWETVYDYKNLGKVHEESIDLLVTDVDEFVVSGRGFVGFGGTDIYTARFVSSATDVTGDEIIPESSILMQNYPNPFNPSTNFKFNIADALLVTLKIYDILGKEVATVVNQELSPGAYDIKYDAGNLSSGVYFYTLNAGDYRSTMKMTLMK